MSQNGTPNMTVVLGPGRAQIVGTAVSPPAGQVWTTQAQYNAYNDANLSLTVTASNPTNPRIDLCVLSIQDAAYSGATNTAVASIIAGTPAVSPVAPSAPTNSIILAQIAVAANATTIVTANIAYQASLPSIVNTATAATTTNLATLTTAIGATGQRLGLWTVVPTATGTGVSVSANGSITCAATPVLTVANSFSATFSNYVCILDGTFSNASASLTAQLSTAGVAVTSGYSYQVTNFSTVTGYNQSGAVANWSMSHTPPGAGLGISYHIEFFGPAKNAATRYTLYGSSVASATAVTSGLANGQLTGTTGRDGITFTLSVGTFSGTVRFYGYNDET